MPVPGRPVERCGPFVFGLIRDPASRSIGCEISAMAGYGRAFNNANACLLGLINVCGSGSASNTSTMCCGGTAYFGGSLAPGTCAASVGATIRRAKAIARAGRLSMDRSFVQQSEIYNLESEI